MINGVCYDEILQGYNQWINNQKISEMEEVHLRATYNMIIDSCMKFRVEIKFGKSSFDVRDGWVMKEEWLKKYAYGFLREIEKHLY